MHEDRLDDSTATALTDGTVLVAGGVHGSAEIFDVSSGEFSEVASMAVGRQGASATLLDSGKVLVAGGYAGPFDGAEGLASAEIYDPVTQMWAATGVMHDARFGQTATRLGDGRVLVVAGWKSQTEYLDSAEI